MFRVTARSASLYTTAARRAYIARPLIVRSYATGM